MCNMYSIIQKLMCNTLISEAGLAAHVSYIGTRYNSKNFMLHVCNDIKKKIMHVDQFLIHF